MSDDQLRQKLIEAGASAEWLEERTVPFVAREVAEQVIDKVLDVLVANADEWFVCDFHKAAGEANLDCWGAGINGQDSCSLVPVILIPLAVLRNGRTE